MGKTEKHNEEKFAFNDFQNEWHLLQVFSGFKFIKTSKFTLTLNILYDILIHIIHGFTGIMAVLTLMESNAEKTDVVHILEIVPMVIYNIVIPNLVLHFSENLNSAMKSLKEGVYKYSGGVDKEHIKIKKKYVGHIITFNSKFSKLLIISIFSYLIGIPFSQYLNGKKIDYVNPILPIPIKMPFDTFTITGFLGAYLINGIQIVFLHMKGICFGKVILSSSLQLSAQIEILNHSLRHIEERVHSRMRKGGAEVRKGGEERKGGQDEFQECIYECLRESVLHHHAILRLTRILSPFMSASVFFSTLIISLVMGSQVIVIIQDPTGNIAMAFMLFCVVLGFLSICWVGQTVTNQSSLTIEAVYSTPWYSCHKRYNVLLNMMITNTRKPIVFSSVVLNSSLSYEFFSDMVTFAYKVATLLI